MKKRTFVVHSLDGGPRLVSDAHNGEVGQQTQHLLRANQAHVNAHLRHVNRHAKCTRHAVDQEETIVYKSEERIESVEHKSQNIQYHMERNSHSESQELYS